MPPDTVDAALGYLSKDLIAQGIPLDEYLKRMAAAEAAERLPLPEDRPMHHTAAPPVPRLHPDGDLQDYLNTLSPHDKVRLLQEALVNRPPTELVAALIELADLNAILDWFSEEVGQHLTER